MSGNPFGAGAKDLWVGVVEAAHAKIADKLATAKYDHTANVLEQIETDVRDVLAPILGPLLEHPDYPDVIHDLANTLTNPEHFGQSLILGIALGAVLAPILQAPMQPFTTALTQTAFSLPGNQSLALSPAEVALGVLRNNKRIADPYGEAAKSGVSANNLDALIYNTGDSLALGDLMTLWRRADIDDTVLETGLRESRVRDEWLPFYKMLQFSTPSIGDVLAARVKSHLGDDEARVRFQQAGGNPANYEWMRDTAGRPPGIEQMLHLWNRGDAGVGEAEVDAAIAQSDIAPFFAPFVKYLRWYIPPVRSIMPMLRSGAINADQATALFREQGVRDTDIPGYLKEAEHARTSTVKTLTEAQVVKGYTLRRIDRAGAQARIVALGYTVADAQLYLDLADEQRVERLRDALVSKIGTLYTAHKMTKTEAVTALNADQVPTTEQADLFHVWDLARAATVFHPSPTQIVGAFRRGMLTGKDAHDRLIAAGVQPADLIVIVADGYPVGKDAEMSAAIIEILGAAP